MNDRLYIVRVWPELRYESPYSGEVNMRSGPGLISAFLSAAAADRFASGRVPFELNPFINACPADDEDYDEDDEQGEDLLVVFIRDEAADYAGDFSEASRTVSLPKLRALIHEQGLTPPEERDPYEMDEVYRDWWEKNAPQMTEAQKTTLWRFLIPNPYDIIEVPLIDDRE